MMAFLVGLFVGGLLGFTVSCFVMAGVVHNARLQIEAAEQSLRAYLKAK